MSEAEGDAQSMERIASTLREQRHSIHQAWLKHLPPASGANQGLHQRVRQHIDAETDLLSILVAVLDEKPATPDLQLAAIIDALRRQASLYSVTDVFEQAWSLQEAVEAFDRQTQPVRTGAPNLHELLSSWLGRVCVELLRSYPVPLGVVDQAPVGVVRLDGEARLRYANQEAQGILNRDDWRGIAVEELFSDRERYREMRKRRQGGKSDAYYTELIPKGPEGPRVPVHIIAFPDSNSPDSSVTAIIRKSTENVALEIHKKLDADQDYRDVLNNVAQELRRVVDFDIMFVSRFSRDQRHVCKFHEYYSNPQEEQVSNRKRWYSLSGQMAGFARLQTIWFHNNYLSFIKETDEGLLQDRAVKDIVDRGIHSVIVIPINTQDVKAAVSLLSRCPTAYSERDCKTLRQLPITEAIVHAVRDALEDEFKYRFDLLRAMDRCSTIQSVADTVTRSIANHYGWDNVTLYRIDHNSSRLILQSQYSTTETMPPLPEYYEQPLSDGALGELIRQDLREGLYSGNIHTDDRYAHLSARSGHCALSNLCLPVYWEDEIRWVLSVDSKLENAFSEDERQMLRATLDDVGKALEDRAYHLRLSETFDLTSDAVLFTDSDHRLRNLNPAAARLFGRSIGTPALDLFRDTTLGECILEGDSTPNIETTLLDAQGGEIEVLLSTATLPPEIPGSVLIAKDLSRLRRAEQLDRLGEVLYEIALQVQTPLWLAFSWIRRYLDAYPEASPVHRELLEKSLQQLRRVELTSDQLALYDPNRAASQSQGIHLNLCTEVRRALDDFPAAERDRIELEEPPGTLPYVKCDPFEFGFVLRTLLAYLARRPRSDGTVHCAVVATENEVVLNLQGGDRDPADGTGAGERRFLARLRANITLNDALMRRFIVENHGGRYEAPKRGDKYLAFEVALPIASEARR